MIKKKVKKITASKLTYQTQKLNVGGALLDKSCMAISIERSY